MSFFLLILTISGTRTVKGNDPVTEEQGASVAIVHVDETGYSFDPSTLAK